MVNINNLEILHKINGIADNKKPHPSRPSIIDDTLDKLTLPAGGFFYLIFKMCVGYIE